MSVGITVRLAKEESEALTRLRVARETRTGQRWTLIALVFDLVLSAEQDLLRGVTVLPVKKPVSRVPVAAVFERCYFRKTPEVTTALLRLRRTAEGEDIRYSEADMLRFLIARAEEMAKHENK